MNKKGNIILIIVFIILVLILFVVLKSNNSTSNDVNTSSLKKVIDYNDFYTIEGCANKFYGYLSTNDTTNINYLLDDTSTNFKNNYINKNISIKVNEMFNKDNDYYLKGIVIEELITGYNKLNTEYLLIKLNSDKTLFSVEVLSNKEYNEVIDGY